MIDMSNTASNKNCIICFVASWYNATAPRLFYRHARLVAEAGYETIIVARHKKNEIINGIRILGQPDYSSRIHRFLSGFKIIRDAWKTRADLYVFYDLELQPWALLFKIAGKRILVDIFEDNPSAMLIKAWIPKPMKGIFSSLVATWEWITAHIWDGIITADPEVMKRFEWKSADRRSVIYNFPNLSAFLVKPIKRKVYDVVYVGGLSIPRGTILLARAVKMLRDRGYKYQVLLIGNYINSETEVELNSFLSQHNMKDQFTITGYLPYKEAMHCLSSAKVGVIPFEKGIKKYESNIPSKMFDYWAAGLPILVTSFKSVELFIKNGENGLLIPAGSVEKLADALHYLLIHPDVAEKMAKTGQKQVFERWNADGPNNKALVALFNTVLY